ncbi:aldose 1-epimerase [Paracoccus aestuariivivens]|uniref:Aldose 1-epimerase n=1 Tax=Paracoccus aestuariivivens TaxID=1820333 RepID=A0A6L6J8G1_9RHOB|nr:aldose 1-epimerase [Paracoccus aestuariivivens]MTH76917.1 hypothetical protein [Paracoccus aestuariivivens]
MITLQSGSYRLTVAPEYGATILSAEWLGRDEWKPVLEPLASPENGLKAGCFVMAPFANRIDHGHFFFDGKSFQLPINNIPEDMAIHGFARNHVWKVTEQAADHVLLVLDLNEPSLPWQFTLVQQISIAADGIKVALHITNLGDAPMPFGFGLHPWFPKPAETYLSFASDGAHTRDARGLPLPDLHPVQGMSENDQKALDGLPWFDACIGGWNPRKAVLRWPEYEVALSASGALRHLHVYNPDDRPVVCAEPVSHLPDVINRPELGEDAQMTVLAPGETLSGKMHLAARPIG